MKLEIKGERAVLHTRMVPAIMNVVPQLEGRRKWLKGGGLSLEATGHNLEVLQREVAGLEIKDETPQNLGLEALPDALGCNRTYEPKTPPYDHQIPAITKCRTQPRFALFMEQGTGKTWVALTRCGELWAEGKLTGVAVVTKRGVHRQWIEEQIPKLYGADHKAEFWPMKDLPNSMLPGDCLKFFAINIDATRTKRGAEMLKEFLDAHGQRVMLIIDESQDIKNDLSKRWEAMNKLGHHLHFKMIMTGTPIAKELMDEWAQLKWLDPKIIGIKYRKSFRNEFCLMGGFEGNAVVGHKNIERFQAKVDPYMIRVTKDQAGILPKQYERFRFDLTKKQKQMIKDIKTDLLVQIDTGEEVTAANAAVAVMKMQQISNGFIAEKITLNGDTIDSKIHRLMEPGKNPRLMALKDYLDAQEGKVVIWARFIEDIRQIKELLGEQCVTYYGGDNDKQRVENKHRFINDPDVDWFLSNPQVGGTGLDGLQTVTHRAAYYSNSDNSIQRWQSEDRISRMEEIGGAILTDLVALGCPDSKILNNLKNKKAFSDMALGDIRSWLEGDDLW